MSPEAQRFAAGATDFAFLNELTEKDIPDHLVQLGIPGLPPKVLVWGDSHAMAILPAVDLACKKAGISGRAATSSSTPPTLEWFCYFQYGLNEKAPEFNASVLKYIKSAASHGLSYVILVASWEGYLKSDNERFQAALRRTILAIQATGCQAAILIDVPRFPFDPPRALTMSALHAMWPSHLVINSAQHLADTALQRPVLTELSQLGATVIDPAEFFTDANGIIRPADNMGALYRDNHHLSTHGSLRLTDVFSTIIKPQAR